MSPPKQPFPPALLPYLPAIHDTLTEDQLTTLRNLDLKTTPDPELISHHQKHLSEPCQPPSSPPFRHPDSCLSLSRTLLHLLATSILPQSTTSLSKLSLILSVGSGTGLLERCLQLSTLTFGPQSHNPSTQPIPDPEFDDTPVLPQSEPTSAFTSGLLVCGVEVHDTVNRYLPGSSMTVVRGTWEVAREVERAAALLFVYPRQAGLMERCLEKFAESRGRMAAEDVGGGRGTGCWGTVVWLGPVVDWEAGGFGDVMERWAQKVGGTMEEKRGAEMGLLEEEMGVLVRVASNA